jgi:hypothetical protein
MAALVDGQTRGRSLTYGAMRENVRASGGSVRRLNI